MTIRNLGVFLLGAGSLIAQRLPTTLDELVRRADVVVRARVLGLAPGTDGKLRVGFLTQENFVGDAPRTFALEESDDQGCARALAGLVPNLGVVLILARDGENELALLDGDPNAAWSLEPALLDRLRTILSPATPSTSLDAALAALADGSPRLRLDAAHSLARSPVLAAMSPTGRDRLDALLPRLRAEAPALLEPLGRAVERLDDPRLDTRFAVAVAGVGHDREPYLALVDRLLARRSTASRENLLNALRRDGVQDLPQSPHDETAPLPRFRAIRPYRR
jgi:hypothetical protein